MEPQPELYVAGVAAVLGIVCSDVAGKKSLETVKMAERLIDAIELVVHEGFAAIRATDGTPFDIVAFHIPHQPQHLAKYQPEHLAKHQPLDVSEHQHIDVPIAIYIGAIGKTFTYVACVSYTIAISIGVVIACGTYI